MQEVDLMRIAVAIPTVGRPATVRAVIEQLQRQTRPADMTIVVGGGQQDVEGLSRLPSPPIVRLSERGLCKQRNAALRAIGNQADLVIFFDDDFLAHPTYLEEAEQLFESAPHIAGATGRIIADGIGHTGYDFAEALDLVSQDHRPADPNIRPAEALYGCNMVLRLSTMNDLRFDERLPLYGWLEDIDLTYRLGRRGELVRSDFIAGVHMGIKAGRQSGLRFGYSQIANPIYMLRKRSAPVRLAFSMMAKNLAANMVRSLWPEAHVDRRGRLRGNLLALVHLMTKRLDPQHILTLA
jgi:glycosyltransferase involved in cell wall biosynthesis